jgi:hypothetical protein
MGAQSSKQISRKLPQNIVSKVESSAFETHSTNKVSNETIIQESINKGMYNINNQVIIL